MKKLFYSSILSLVALLTLTTPVAAATFTFPAGAAPFTDLGKLLANLLFLLFFFAAFLAFVFIIIGGIQWITAGGDKMAAQAARDRITAAVVGLIIVVAAFAISLIVMTLLGVNILQGQITFPGADNPIFGPTGPD